MRGWSVGVAFVSFALVCAAAVAPWDATLFAGRLGAGETVLERGGCAFRLPGIVPAFNLSGCTLPIEVNQIYDVVSTDDAVPVGPVLSVWVVPTARYDISRVNATNVTYWVEGGGAVRVLVVPAVEVNGWHRIQVVQYDAAFALCVGTEDSEDCAFVNTSDRISYISAGPVRGYLLAAGAHASGISSRHARLCGDPVLSVASPPGHTAVADRGVTFEYLVDGGADVFVRAQEAALRGCVVGGGV